MGSVVGDAIAVPQKIVDLLGCPGLALFEESKELLELFGRELRGPAAREARSESIHTCIVPRSEPSVTGMTGDTNTLSSNFG